MKLVILILAIVITAGCIETTPLTWVCPDGTEVLGGPSQCPQSSFCKGNARCFNGTVTKITDGDTLEVNNIPIRLALVNKPEYNEEGYNETKELASSICPVGSNAVVDEDDGQTAGSYGRIVAVVYCGNFNLNAMMTDNEYVTIDKNYCDVSEFANEDWTNC